MELSNSPTALSSLASETLGSATSRSTVDSSMIWRARKTLPCHRNHFTLSSWPPTSAARSGGGAAGRSGSGGGEHRLLAIKRTHPDNGFLCPLLGAAEPTGRLVRGDRRQGHARRGTVLVLRVRANL